MFVVVAVVAVSLVLGYTTGAAVGSRLLAITLFCLLVFAVLLWAGRRPRNFSGQAPEAEQRAPGRWRILLVASETPTVEQLHVLRTAVPRAMLEVHAPILRSRGQNLTTDVSEEIELARNRLRTILTRAGSAGIDASGEVGDPIDPVAAIENQLHRHHVDEVVVATNPLSGANPVEADLLRDLRSQLHKPLTHVEIR
jgi:DNA polymerase III psi subunit